MLVIGAGLLASVLPFVRPSSAHPVAADAVVVLSGDRGERLARGLELVRAGVAPTLVLAGSPDFAEADRLCRESVPFEVVCLRPAPDSTRYEARAVARLAADRGWHHLVVATSTVHVTRAGLLFRRCVRGTVDVVGARPRYGVRTRIEAVAHEWLGTVGALTVRRGC